MSGAAAFVVVAVIVAACATLCDVCLLRVKNIGKRYPADYGKYSPEILHIIAQKHDFDQVHGK